MPIRDISAEFYANSINKLVTGEEAEFEVTFTTPFDLSGDHYFFVPQVEVTTLAVTSSGFPHLSPSSRRVRRFQQVGLICKPGPATSSLIPDWLRVGRHIAARG